MDKDIDSGSNPLMNIPLFSFNNHSQSPTFVEIGTTPAFIASMSTFGKAS